MPDPRLIRRIIRQRQLRGQFFDGELFADPAWDMLLDLAASRAEHKRVSVTSLCIASGVPPTTALRWIALVTEGGLLERVEDETDRRRAFIALTDRAADAVARFFSELGRGPTVWFRLAARREAFGSGARGFEYPSAETSGLAAHQVGRGTMWCAKAMRRR